MNPFHPFVSGFDHLYQEGKKLPLGQVAPHPLPQPSPNAPKVLLFSPHPDDECVIGAFPLRILQETGARVINVAVTLGSNRERQQPRLAELRRACEWIGFDLEPATPNGLEKINPQTRQANPVHWAAAASVIANILSKHQPAVIFCPHLEDSNSSHIGTHLLVMDALKTLPSTFHCFLVETEFWGQMTTPNLMVESSVENVAELLAALSFHVGEVQRNPYHLRLPAWMLDNVRRGAELVGGQGGAAPDFLFATLYRIRQWQQGQLSPTGLANRQISLRENAGSPFGWTAPPV